MPVPRRLRTAQKVMGVAFTSMGVATMLFPQLVLDLSFPRSYLLSHANSSVVSATSSSSSLTYAPILTLLVRCFGSQASLCGLLILTSEFNKMTNLYFGLAMIPYLVFDVAGYVAGALTPFGAIGDAVGNLIFTTCCYIGYKDGDESGGVNDEEKKK